MMNELLALSGEPAMLITDRQGLILSANAAAAGLFADTETGLNGKDIRDLVRCPLNDDAPPALMVCQRLGMLPEGTNHSDLLLSVNEMQMEKQMILVILLRPVHRQPGTVPITDRTDLFSQAVTTLEQAKDEAQTALQREKELSRLKTRFISLASHEFRSPLSSIQLSVALIERYYDRLGRDKVFFHLRKIRRAIVDLTGILEDFLSLERIDAGKLETHIEVIDLPAFCHELLLEMQPQAKPGQQLAFGHQGNGDHFPLDRKILRHCLMNLLSNAIKYSGENSAIRLSTRVSDEGCDVTLEDEGLGIPTEDQQHIFEPFFRAGNVIDKQGAGLGLSIVRRYCDLMNGTVSFESRENQGTIFTLWFPVACRPAVPE